MKVKAKISFCGTVCMAAGEIRDVPEGGVINDLLNAGYVERLEDAADLSKPKEAKKNEAKRGKSE